MLEAEALLATTGLLLPPDRSAVIASRIKVKELTNQLLAALDREEPARLRVNDQKSSYAKRLAVPPDYQSTIEALEDLTTLGLAGAYQLAHTNARHVLLARAPKVSIDYVSGTKPQPVDPLAEAQYLHEVDTVENQRLIHDVASAAVLPEAVEVFKAAFPTLHGHLAGELRTSLVRKAATGWVPPHWLESALRLFLQAPAEGPVDVHSPAAPASPEPKQEEPKKAGKTDLNTKALSVHGTELPK